MLCVVEVQGRDLFQRVNTEDERETTVMSSPTNSPSMTLVVFVAPGESCPLSLALWNSSFILQLHSMFSFHFGVYVYCRPVVSYLFSNVNRFSYMQTITEVPDLSLHNSQLSSVWCGRITKYHWWLFSNNAACESLKDATLPSFFDNVQLKQ